MYYHSGLFPLRASYCPFQVAQISKIIISLPSKLSFFVLQHPLVPGTQDEQGCFWYVATVPFQLAMRVLTHFNHTVGNVPYNMGEVSVHQYSYASISTRNDRRQEQLIEAFKTVGQVVGFRCVTRAT